MTSAFPAVALAFLQAKRVPVQGGNDDGGAALIFLLLIGLVFFLIATAFIAAFTGILRAAGASERAQTAAFVPSALMAGSLIWYFWEPVRETLVPVSKYSWIVLLIVFGLIVVCAVLAVLFNGMRSAFSRENVAGTLGLVAIAGATVYLYNFSEWNFWPSLGVSFAAVIGLQIVGLLLWKLLAKRPSQREAE